METNLKVIAKVFQLLADETRLTIIALLKEQELCVCDITLIMGISQPKQVNTFENLSQQDY